MQGKAERSYLMQLVDDAERIVMSDPLGEEIPPATYALDGSGKEKDGADGFYRAIASCHSCRLCYAREVFAYPIVRKEPRVLFIVENPEGKTILDGSSLETFRAFWKDSLRLGEGEWALTSLIKCPGGWDPSCADACRHYMRSELSSIAPRAIVLMGMNGARYMLGERGTDDAYLGRRFIVNHIPLYVTYSPAEYRADRSLRTRIWDNLLFIRKELGLDAVR